MHLGAIFSYHIPGYFASLPPHDHEGAIARAVDLGLDRHTHRRRTSYASMTTGAFAIGVYPEGELIIHNTLAWSMIDIPSARTLGYELDDPEGFKARILRQYPESELLTLCRHDIVDVWGYSLFRGGGERRVMTGHMEADILVSRGAPLPEEECVFNGDDYRQSILEYGERITAQSEGDRLLDAVGELVYGEKIAGQDFSGPFYSLFDLELTEFF